MGLRGVPGTLPPALSAWRAFLAPAGAAGCAGLFLAPSGAWASSVMAAAQPCSGRGRSAAAAEGRAAGTTGAPAACVRPLWVGGAGSPCSGCQRCWGVLQGLDRLRPQSGRGCCCMPMHSTLADQACLRASNSSAYRSCLPRRTKWQARSCGFPTYQLVTAVRQRPAACDQSCPAADLAGCKARSTAQQQS